MSYTLPESAMGEFFSEAEEIISRVNGHLGKLESEGLTDTTIDSLYRDIHTLKGSSQLFGFGGIAILGHALEACLDPIRSKRIPLNEALINRAYECMDLISQVLKEPDIDLKKEASFFAKVENLIGHLVDDATDAFDSKYQTFSEYIAPTQDLKLTLHQLRQLHPELAESRTKAISSVQSSSPIHRDHSLEAKLETAKHHLEIAKPRTESDSGDTALVENSTIRIQIGLLDRMMNLIGEMVLVRNQVLQYNQKKDDYEFHDLSQRLDLVTSELQENVMKTRMQPIGNVLSKFQRVVRDIAKDLKKKIEFSVRGAETELDKSLIEIIKDPITHIVRNSCDHGIESPEERRRIGKDEIGQIQVFSYHEGGQVIIEITDDGRGMNPGKILEKAIEKKIISPELSLGLNDREIFQLIFAPGFSTAEHVSALSGRGVGLDVVKTNIEKAGGVIDLHSKEGRGTTIRLRIPLTLAIVPAMLIGVQKETFAIPQVKLQELVRIDMEGDGPKIEMLQGHPIYRLRGNLLPLIFLDQILYPNRTESSEDVQKTILNIVVLSSEGQPFGLVVDQIRDTADIVVKPLPKFLKKLNIFSGATIMGDGSVSLILDVLGLSQKANLASGGDKKAEVDNRVLTASRNKMQNEQELLFFKLNGPGRYCIPLILVQRLEEFPVSQIEVSGRERIVKYRNSILPLINLNDFLQLKPTNEVSPRDKISVIVVSKRRRLFGIEVNQIFDVVSLSTEIESALQETQGVLGNIIAGDFVATVIDVLGIIECIADGVSTPKSQPKKLSGTKNTKKPIRILFAEDTPFFVKHVLKILEDLDVEVVHAEDGEAALKILKKAGPKAFDLLLSDIEMPRLNGFELAEKIRMDAQFGNLPMIALSTRYKEADVKKGLACGFNKYLEKLNVDQLKDAITNQLGGFGG